MGKLGLVKSKNADIAIYWCADLKIYKPYLNNLIVNQPQKLKSLLAKSDLANSDYWKCPAFHNELFNVYALPSQIDYKASCKNNNISLSNFDPTFFENIFDLSNLKDNIVIVQQPFLFFSESDITIKQIHPYLHQQKYNVLQGSYNISKWFRPLNISYLVENNEFDISFKNNQILSYIHFNTDKKIKLHQFNFTDKMEEIMRNCANKKFESNKIQSLLNNYNFFKNNRYNSILLKEIKRNLV